MLALYVNPNLKVSQSLVFSAETPAPVSCPEMVFGDSQAANLFLVDGLGGYDSRSGQSGVTVKVGIGDLTSSDPVWMNQSWTPIANGWSGIIATNTTEVMALFNGQNVITASLRIQVTDALGNEQTIAVVPFRLWNLGISSATQPSPSANPQDGQFDIPSGQDFVVVTGLALSSIPRRVLVNVQKPSGGLNIFGTVDASTITTDGFRVDLSGQTDADGYTLEYQLLFG